MYICAHTHTKIMEEYKNDRLGQLEHEENLLYNISKVVINREYIRANKKFCDVLFFKLFEEYYFAKENVSIIQQAKMVEIFLDSMFKYKPDTELPEDIIKL